MNTTVGDSMKGIRTISRAIITFILTIILSLTFLATDAFADMVTAYNVDIMVGDSVTTVTTNNTSVKSILNQANIFTEPTDKIDDSQFKPGKGGKIVISELKSIKVRYNKNLLPFDVYSNTVGDALTECGINNATLLNCKSNSDVTNKMTINISTSNTIKLYVDSKVYEYPVFDGTVSNLIKKVGVVLNDDDYTTPSSNSSLEGQSSVTVNRVTYKNVTKNVTVKAKTIENEDSSLYEGTEILESNGSNGLKKSTYKITYVNGKQTSKKVVKSKTLKKAVNKVVTIGTKDASGAQVEPNYVTSKNGIKVGQVISGKYTHYCACGTCGTGSGLTASGKRVYNGMKNPYYIACNWLPLGSVVNCDGTNYIVADRGGSDFYNIGRIDIFTPGGHSAALRAGTGYCTLTIVRLGW